MLLIDNLETADDYTRELTLESTFGGRLVYVVANASAYAQWRPLVEKGGSETAEYSPPVLLTPQSSFIDKISGARFRTAVSGSPARIVAQLSEPGDILPAAGTPFTATLAGSGAVTTAELDLRDAGSSATDTLVVGPGFTPVSGLSITFTVVGAAAEVGVHFVLDWENVATGWGQALGVAALNGVPVGPFAILNDNGLAVQRGTFGQCVLLGVGVGANTIDVRQQKTAAGGNVRSGISHSRLLLEILDK